MPSQAATFRVSGKLVGGPPVLRGRFGGYVVIALQGNATSTRSKGIHGGVIDEEPRVVSLYTRLESDGTFSISNVPPGTYRLMGSPADAVQRRVFTVTVTDRDVTDITIPLVRTDVVANRRNLFPAWSLPGPWSGVAGVANDGAIYVAVPGDPNPLPPFAMPA